MGSKVVALIGSYRKGGATDKMVAAVLDGAREKGAETHTIYLTERRIEFCTNCRKCMRAAGDERGKCLQQDELQETLGELLSADAIVLGSPVNLGNVTAIFRRFMERLCGAGYWPWGQKAPSARKIPVARKAAIVVSSAMPGFLVPIATGVGYAMRTTAGMLGAKPVANLFIGFAAGQPEFTLSAKQRERARRVGWKLASQS